MAYHFYCGKKKIAIILLFPKAGTEWINAGKHWLNIWSHTGGRTDLGQTERGQNFALVDQDLGRNELLEKTCASNSSYDGILRDTML